jgi:hypothetical protein
MSTAKRLLICLGCILAASAAWAQTEENSDATSATTGTVAITLTVTVETAGVKAVYCSGIVGINDGALTALTVYEVSTTVAATGSGATRTCDISVPYSFVLATPTSDGLTVSYTISAPTGATPLGRTLGATPIKTIKPLPKSGSTTNLAAAATI